MDNPDALLRELREKSRAKEEVDWRAERERLRAALACGIGSSVKVHEYRKLTAAAGRATGLSILDFGCGGGVLVLYLTLLGYEARGVDLGDVGEAGDFLARLLGEDGLGPRIASYDGRRLPFEDNSFDVVISEMVMEHVRDPDAYYSEAARVLKPGGVALLDFMHRLVPFDSHSRRWFIHWFPRPLRNLLYDRLTTEGAGYYSRILNLRGLGYHRRLARRYFSQYFDETSQRLENYTYPGRYEGSLSLRLLADRCIKLPVLGRVMLSLLSCLACADIRLVK